MRIAVIAIVFTASMVYGEKPKAESDAHRRNSTEATHQADSATGGSVIVVQQQISPRQQDNHPGDAPSYFHELLLPQNLPNIALVIVAAVTGWYIAKQARETTKATQAMLDGLPLQKNAADAALANAQSVIDAERAWIMVDLKLRDTGVEQKNSAAGKITLAALNFICSNEGRSIAWVTEKAMVFKIVESLPQEPDFSSLLPIFGNEPEPLVPSPSPKSTSVERIHPWIHGWRGDSGNLVTLYGFVRYRDIFGKTRETRYGYSVNIDYRLERLVGYPKYNENA